MIDLAYILARVAEGGPDVETYQHALWNVLDEVSPPCGDEDDYAREQRRVRALYGFYAGLPS